MSEKYKDDIHTHAEVSSDSMQLLCEGPIDPHESTRTHVYIHKELLWAAIIWIVCGVYLKCGCKVGCVTAAVHTHIHTIMIHNNKLWYVCGFQ